MAKNFKRMLATTLVMSMLVSALPMQALAEETHDTITNGDVTTEITTTTTVTGGENGSPTVTVEIQQSESSGTTESGANLSGSGSSTTTTVTDSSNNTISSSSNSSSTTTTTTTDSATGTTTEVTTDVVTKNEVNADGSTYDYEKSFTISSTTDAEGNLLNQHWVEDGKESSTEKIQVDNVTVTVPETDKDDPATKETENSNTVTFGGEAGSKSEGNINSENGKTTTTVTPGKVTVTTKDVDFNATTLKEVIDENGNVTYVEVIPEKIVDENGNVVQGTDLDYVHSEVKPSNGKTEGTVDNDLFIWVYNNNRVTLPGKGE